MDILIMYMMMKMESKNLHFFHVVDVRYHTFGFYLIFYTTEPSDHDPVNMFEVFKNPENFLGGPNSKVNKTKRMTFVVIGAGIAGLTNARMLLEVGHRVSIY